MEETATEEKRAAADPTSDPKDETEEQHIRLVLQGKTGTGKSSLAGFILGENVFEIHHTAISGTSKCQKETRQVDGGSITVIDTPGIFDTRNCDKFLKSEVIDMIIESSDGLDAFLILFKVERFTEQENEVVSKIMECFSEEAFKHSVVVFTHGDQLPDNMKIQAFVSKNQYLRDLLEKCGNRCCVVDNKYWKDNQQDEYRNNQVQVAKLLQTVKKMVKSRGRYTNEMLQTVKRMERQEEERIRRSAVDMSVEEIRNQARSNVNDKLKMLAGVTTGVLLGAFLGVPHMVSLVLLKLRQNRRALSVVSASGVVSGAASASGVALRAASASGVALRAASASDVVSGAASASGVTLYVAAGIYAGAGAAMGGCIGYEEADKAESVQEAVKNTAEALIEPIRQILEGPNITPETERNFGYN